MQAQIPVAAGVRVVATLLVAVQEELHLVAVAEAPLVVVACRVKEEVEKVVTRPICSFFVAPYPHLYLVGCNTTLEPYHK